MLPLHHDTLCTNHPEDITRMTKIVAKRGTLNQEDLNKHLKDAVYSSHDRCIAYLLSIGASGDVSELMKIAAGKGFYDIVEMLIENGCSQNDLDATLYHINQNVYHAYQYIMTTETNDVRCSIFNTIAKHGFTFQPFRYMLSNMSYPGFVIPRNIIVSPLELRCILMNNFDVDWHENVTDVSYTYEMTLLNYIIMHSVFYFGFQEIPIREAKELLYILHQFGVNFWHLNAEGKNSQQMLEFFLSEQSRQLRNQLIMHEYELMYSQYNKACKELKEHFDELMRTPLSLKSLCRLSLHRRMKTRYLEVVEQLTTMLPIEVVHFLQGADMAVPTEKIHTPLLSLQYISYYENLIKEANTPDFYNFVISRCIPIQHDDDLETISQKIQNFKTVGRQFLNMLYQVDED